MITIPNWTCHLELKNLKAEVLTALEKVLSSGRLILGNELERFETDFASFCDCHFGVGVNSGTDALFLALKGLQLQAGDEVITVSNTAVPTVAAIRAAGCVPRFVDIDEDFYTMNVSQIASAINSKTRAILPVHLYGQSVDMDPLLQLATKHNLIVIEDCAQAHGTLYKGKKIGSLGHISAFSFYPTKILGAYGDAGMCMTQDPSLANRLRLLRMYGMKGEYYSYIEGYNSRLDEMQAAVLNVKLKYLEESITHRQKIAAFYTTELSSVLQTPKPAPYSTHSYYLYVVRHSKREKIMKELLTKGIETRIHFPHPIHLMEAYCDLGYQQGALPVTERVAQEIFSLPLYPFISESTVEQVITAIRNILRA